MSQIQAAKLEMENYPKGTRIFMFVMFIMLCGFFGFIFTFWTEIIWLQIIATLVGLVVGGLLGYFICLKSLFNNEYKHDNRNTLENAVKPISFSEEDRIEELDRKAKKRRKISNIIWGAWGISLVGAILLGMVVGVTLSVGSGGGFDNFDALPPRGWFAIGCIAYFVGNFVTVIPIFLIVTKIMTRRASRPPKNAVTAEGIVAACSLIGGSNNNMAYQVHIAVLSIDKLLSTYVRAQGMKPPYEKGDRVTVEYNSMKPKKCRILTEPKKAEV